ncbi:MAG: tandem-95 repeat protein [Chlamydiota bacterium]|nr:tandem-95 repeat protein [Chlamydiota bacterium]
MNYYNLIDVLKESPESFAKLLQGDEGHPIKSFRFNNNLIVLYQKQEPLVVTEFFVPKFSNDRARFLSVAGIEESSISEIDATSSQSIASGKSINTECEEIINHIESKSEVHSVAVSLVNPAIGDVLFFDEVKVPEHIQVQREGFFLLFEGLQSPDDIRGIFEGIYIQTDTQKKNSDSRLLMIHLGISDGGSEFIPLVFNGVPAHVIEEDRLRLGLLEKPKNGSVMFDRKGVIAYVPLAAAYSSDQFAFLAFGDEGEHSSSTVSLHVDPVKSRIDNLIFDQKHEVTIAGELVTFYLIESPKYGSVNFEKDGSFTFSMASEGYDHFAFIIDKGKKGKSMVIFALNESFGIELDDDEEISAYQDYSVIAAIGGSIAAISSMGVKSMAMKVQGRESAEVQSAITPDIIYVNTLNTVSQPVLNNQQSLFIENVTETNIDQTREPESIPNQVNGTPVDSLINILPQFNLSEDSFINFPPSNLAQGLNPALGPFTLQIVSAPTNGTVILLGDGSITYTPNPNFAGTDSSVINVIDNTGAPTAITVTYNVAQVNDKPVADNENFVQNEDVVLNVNSAAGVLSGDTDIEGTPLIAQIVTNPTNGVVVLNPDGSFIYTPNLDYNGVDSFTYEASDGDLVSDPATVTITINPVNDKPVANPDSFTVSENGSIVVSGALGVLSNDTDVDSVVLTAAQNSPAVPLVGASAIGADGSFTMSLAADPDFSGIVTLTYVANDGFLDSDAGTITVLVDARADTPTVGRPEVASTTPLPLFSGDTATLTLNGQFFDFTDGSEEHYFLLEVGASGWFVSNGTVVVNPDGVPAGTYVRVEADPVLTPGGVADVDTQIAPVFTVPGDPDYEVLSLDLYAVAEEVNVAVGDNPADNISTDQTTAQVVIFKASSIISGDAAANVLNGTPGNELIIGREGDDTISTAAGGNNVVVGGSGDDTMTSGAGVDTFLFLQGDEGTVGLPSFDEIFSFTKGPGGDVIDLSNMLFNEENGVLTDYLDFTVVGPDTLLDISVDGDLTIEAQINFDNVDLSDGGALATDLAIINALIADGNLVVDS